jgi:hypothetical protein
MILVLPDPSGSCIPRKRDEYRKAGAKQQQQQQQK